MEKADRKARLAIVSAILLKEPGRLFNLKHFCDKFGAAKSTMSEDISILKSLFRKYGEGEIEVLLGAGGGVRYIPCLSPEQKTATLYEVSALLSDPARILPGGYVYTVDILSNPKYAGPMADILSSMFVRTNPDFVVTVETKGVAIALLVARALGKPLVVARRDLKITEGSAVTINYVSNSSSRMMTMALSKRAVSAGQKALIIDDFIAGGGTVHALCEMMKEFAITVVGVGAAIVTSSPAKKQIEGYKALLQLEYVDDAQQKIIIHPA